MPGATWNIRQISRPDAVGGDGRRSLIECWADVANAGGAVGFAFPPVTPEEVAATADGLIAGLDPQTSRLLVAVEDGEFAGWLHLSRHADPLVTHWGVVSRVQTRPQHRGKGIGVALMNEVRRIARDEMSLEQLRLSARGGAGLEEFYSRLGWTEIGRWAGALRFGPGDDRDEVLMCLTPL